MTRIAPHDVAEVLETDLDSAELTAFIEDAHRIVERRCAPFVDDTSELAAVETYLAAHLATAKEPRVASASHESVEVELDVSPDEYWHQALLVDPSGRLDVPNRGYTVFTTGGDV
jgi:hypothetical protein